jgi:hypothetical protein
MYVGSADCRRHEATEGDLRPMGGVERAAGERQGIKTGFS